ncbi:hypothetical protein CRU92_02890 [Arcobacter sp. FW59]|nr:hypothetical protein CRU92_02890 [Arcobacter sp. FW59]
MKNKCLSTLILGSLLFLTQANADTVKEGILKDETKINIKQQELNKDIEEARVKYSSKPSKLEEKELKYKDKQKELDSKKQELKYKKDNIELLEKIEDKRYQIHLEKIKSKPDMDKIEKLTKERNILEEEFDKNRP